MKAVVKIMNSLMNKYLPDPYVFVVILTFVVCVMGVSFTNSSPLDMVIYWGDGFWKLLSFTMQMVVLLVSGHILAHSLIFKRLLQIVARKIKCPNSAIIIVTIVSLVACWINWGFGLVIGALFAKQIAKNVRDVDYRLLIASAYSGFIVWHVGLSGSIPLSISTKGHPFENIMGIVGISDTIFTKYNLFIVSVIIITLPFFNRCMHPKSLNTVKLPSKNVKEEVKFIHNLDNSFTNCSERSYLITSIISIIGFTYLIYHFYTNGLALDLNIVNTIFIVLGIILHGTPKRFLIAAEKAIRTTSGIVIQFPFYAGIMGMMTSSGLAHVISECFVSISNEHTFYLFSFFSAGLVNFFVPSGGGQWVVQGPILLEAATALQADYAKTAISIAWGDAWTNMIQPFWALPALAIAGLKARDIMGFCVLISIYTGVIIGVGLLLF